MSKQIKLDGGLDIDGAKVKALNMREPTVNDQLAAADIKGSNARQEVALFANLCEVTPEDIGRLTLKDYRKLQEAYADFTD